MPEDKFNDLDAGDTGPVAQCENLIARLVWHFLGPVPNPDVAEEVHRRISAFAGRGRQNEKWFVGEMIPLLDDMKARGEFIDWFPEVAYDEDVQQGSGTLKCDLVLKLPAAHGEAHVLAGVEVKVACMGRQPSARLVVRDGRGDMEVTRGTPWNFDYILTEGGGDNGGVLRDALRLCASQALDERICLVFGYGDPTRAFDAHTDEFAEKLSELAQGRFRVVMLHNCSGQYVIDAQAGRILQAFTCLIRPAQ